MDSEAMKGIRILMIWVCKRLRPFRHSFELEILPWITIFGDYETLHYQHPELGLRA